MKRLLVALIVVAAAIAVLVVLTIPQGRVPLPPASDGSVAGVMHVHTNRSDGMGTPDEIAAAAARAGLKFLVFTDHGDATRAPDPPAYRSGVLCLDAVEISTAGGHYIAFDMPQSPYPLGGEARDVVEDVKRLGGFGIAAHPDSPKTELRWRDWIAPIDGMEILNLDTSWRVVRSEPGWRPKWQLFAALVDYPFRPSEVIASLIRPPGSVYNWEALARRRPVVLTSGADAHARLPLRNVDPGERDFALPFPGYEDSFRVMSVHVEPGAPLTGNAAADAKVVARAIRAGHLYTVVDGLATPPSFQFTATNSRETANEGDEIGLGGAVALHVRSNAPAAFTTIVHEGLRVVASARDTNDLTVHGTDQPSVYWVEIVAPRRGHPPITWLRSNPIYVRPARNPVTVPPKPEPETSVEIFEGRAAEGWRTEHDPTSLAALDLARTVGANEMRFRFGLSGGAPATQSAALVYDTPGGLLTFDRITFTGRAEQPIRVVLVLRAGDLSWERSVYLDTTDREHSVFMTEFAPVGRNTVPKPQAAIVRSLLFAVNTMNTKPGTSGRFWLKSVALQGRAD